MSDAYSQMIKDTEDLSYFKNAAAKFVEQKTKLATMEIKDLFKQYMKLEKFEGNENKWPFRFETLQKYYDMSDDLGMIEVKYDHHKISQIKTRQYAEGALSM